MAASTSANLKLLELEPPLPRRATEATVFRAGDWFAIFAVDSFFST